MSLYVEVVAVRTDFFQKSIDQVTFIKLIIINCLIAFLLHKGGTNMKYHNFRSLKHDKLLQLSKKYGAEAVLRLRKTVYWNLLLLVFYVFHLLNHLTSNLMKFKKIVLIKFFLLFIYTFRACWMRPASID